MAWAICAALFHREKTGRGQLIETTLLGSALAVSNATFQVVESVDAEWRERFFAELERGKKRRAGLRGAAARSWSKVRPLTGARQHPLPRLQDEGLVHRRRRAERGAAAQADGGRSASRTSASATRTGSR